MYKVRYLESEAGWGMDAWTTEYESKEEALKMVEETNREFMGKSRTPDYYIKAEYIGE